MENNKSDNSGQGELFDEEPKEKASGRKRIIKGGYPPDINRYPKRRGTNPTPPPEEKPSK